jgi:hypothetical protein
VYSFLFVDDLFPVLLVPSRRFLPPRPRPRRISQPFRVRPHRLLCQHGSPRFHIRVTTLPELLLGLSELGLKAFDLRHQTLHFRVKLLYCLIVL